MIRWHKFQRQSQAQFQFRHLKIRDELIPENDFDIDWELSFRC